MINQQRSDIVDSIRVFAILLMLFFHSAYDLTMFHYLNINFFTDPFWFWLPRLIVALFLTAVGASLVMSYRSKFDRKKFLIRQGKLVFLSLSVSLLTYFFFPDRWVYFGTLHCIAITSFIGILFIHRPKLSLALALAVICIILVFKWDTTTLSGLFPIRSMDFIPPYPWMGWVWFGIFLAHQKWIFTPLKSTALKHKVRFLSRHSLLIYLIHQPILFSLIYLFSAAQKI